MSMKFAVAVHNHQVDSWAESSFVAHVVVEAVNEDDALLELSRDTAYDQWRYYCVATQVRDETPVGEYAQGELDEYFYNLPR